MIDNEYKKIIIPINKAVFSLIHGTYFITGATGFIGKAFVNTLRFLNQTEWKSDPSTIIIGVRDINKISPEWKQDCNIRIIIYDLLENNYTPDHFDFLVHIAGICNSKMFVDAPVDVLSTNLIGTYNLLNSIKEKEMKSAVYLSTGYVYNSDDKRELIEEDVLFTKGDITKPSFSYIESKIAGECISKSFWKQYNVPINCIRPFNVYGDGQDNSHGGILAEIQRASETKKITMKSDGRAIRNFIYVYDVISAIFYVLSQKRFGESYNVSGDDSITVNELVEMNAKFYKDASREVSVYREIEKSYLDSDIVSYYPSNKKLKSLGWSPQTDIKSGMRKMVAYYIG